MTGASGFIGRRVCAELRECGYELRAAVREPSKASGLSGDVLCVGDMASATDWSRAVAGVDAIIHLAARVHVMKETARDSLHEFRAVNLLATQALATAAAKSGVRRFVYVSSIKVNGEATTGMPFRESDVPLHQDAYGISKWEAEQSLRTISEETGLEVVIVRPPLVYGAGVGGNFLRLLKLVRSGLPLPFGAIENRRSMIYNRNLAHALVACATHRHAAGKTYLVSDGEDVSTANLVRRLGDLMGKRVRLLPIPTNLMQITARCAGKAAEVERLVGSLQVDASAIRADLGWQRPFSVAEGLEDTVRWFQSATAI